MQRRGFSFYALLIPWVIVIFTFTVGFAAYNFVISLTDWQGIFPSYGFVGLKHYLELPDMEGFIPTLKNTAILFLVGLPFGVLLSTVVAMSLDIATTRRGAAAFFRTMAVAPMSIGAVIVAGFWMWMFNFRYGGINDLLRHLGLEALAVDWLGTPSIVMFSIIAMLLWKFAGYGALVVLGGLQAVPEAHLEVARLNGATTRQIYTKVLLPQVRGHILTVGLLLSMYMLKSFDYIWPLTGGGPGWASTLFPVLVYRKMFETNNFAGGAAAATFLFIVVAAIAVPYLKSTRRAQ